MISIASTASNELAHFLGEVSFSEVFFSAVMQGLDVEQAFLLARDAMYEHQGAVMDDDKDGLYDKDVDGTTAAALIVGPSFIAGQDIPQIGNVTPNQLITTGTTVTLWADDISSVYPLQRVWCVVVPPGYDPDTSTGIPVTDILMTSKASLVPNKLL